MAASAGLCFGIDVGGTFTDCVLTEGNRVWRAKSPTTPGEIGKGVLAAAALAAERRGEPLRATLPKVARFGLGTTAITNVLAARTGKRVGLVTTAGFEEMIPFARGSRVIDDEGWLVTPPSIIDLDTIAGVAERIDRDGRIVMPLDATEAESAIRRLVERGKIEALVVSFLWGFRNPVHEEQVTALARRIYPNLIVLSAGLLHPAAREFERTSFALLNAYVSGALGGIDELAAELASLGLKPAVLLVHSQGGSISIAEAKHRPLGLAASGPAAGVAACVTVAKAAGISDVVTCDVGGTSFDVSVIVDGEAASRTRGEVMGMWTALRQVDVESIGACCASAPNRRARYPVPRAMGAAAPAPPSPMRWSCWATSIPIGFSAVISSWTRPRRGPRAPRSASEWAWMPNRPPGVFAAWRSPEW